MASHEWDDAEPNEIFDSIPDLSLFDDGKHKTCVILDDYEFKNANTEQQRRLATLFRMIATHKNCSIYASYQSYFDTPAICRKTTDAFLLYKPTSRTELSTIANRCGVDADFLRDQFRTNCNGHYDSVLIDRTKNSPARVRKNIYEPIDYNSEDYD